jgi:very-short-patch-repair endonuclease
MKLTLEKLKKQATKKFIAFAELLEEGGMDRIRIMIHLDRFRDNYIKKYYNQKDGLIHIRDIIDTKELKKVESKAEYIFYDLLRDNNIPFEFQYKINRYRVDFLINGFLVIEIEGPHHNLQAEYDSIREKYIRRMGYKILRLPIWLLAIEQQMVIDLIKEEVGYYATN